MAVAGGHDEPTPVLLSWSGGKDSAWALQVLRGDPAVAVVALVTTFTEGFDRVSMQGIRRELVRTQAEAAGLPLVEGWIPRQADNATYEAAFGDALASAGERWPGLADVAFGDLFLEDIRAYRDALCTRLGWRTHYPLFGADTRRLAGEMVDGGLRAILCCIDTQQLDGRFAGRDFDAGLLAALPDGVDPCGENGEFHTCVHAGPMFTQPIAVARGGSLLRDGRFCYTDILLP